jgi:hypothetical protein
MSYQGYSLPPWKPCFLHSRSGGIQNAPGHQRMSVCSKYDAEYDRKLRNIAQCNLPFWMAILNVYPVGIWVNCFFTVFSACGRLSDALPNISCNVFIINYVRAIYADCCPSKAARPLPGCIYIHMAPNRTSGYLRSLGWLHGRPSGSHINGCPSLSMPDAGRCGLCPCLGVANSSSRRKKLTTNKPRKGTATSSTSRPELRIASCTGSLHITYRRA